MGRVKFATILLLTMQLGAQPSLKTVTVPLPAGLDTYVQDRQMLIVLGKALFWDMQVGSDARTACATCHFHAGADHRSQHQLASTTATVPMNVRLSTADFPFHLVADPTNNASQVLRTSSNVYGSAGSFHRKYTAINFDDGSDNGYDLADVAKFALDGLNLRQVTGRNSPSVINAVFNARNFWDGRARNVFNGANPFGASDTRSNVMAWRNGALGAERINLVNASLASQAVGPPMSSVEMAYDGLNWQNLGRRLLTLRPLAKQKVALDDSVLAPYVGTGGLGLAREYSYGALVQAAFRPEYWAATETIEGFSQAEWNFALFFGLALQQYQATLVSDDSPFDRFAAGDTSAMSAEQIAGLNVFRGRGGCAGCHAGSEFTRASVGALTNAGGGGRGGLNAGTDTGFFRTGVTPVGDDIGLGARDDFGQPLARTANAGQGAFKTPGLRNIELTGPYMHNGGQSTLEQVVEFYNRGGDITAGGTGPGVRRLNLSTTERASLVAFMKALTDDRVKYQRAPFDHPELCVPNGHIITVQTVDSRYTLSAADQWMKVRSTGKNGTSVPLQTFAELLEGIGDDGSRANTMSEACPAFSDLR